MSTQIERPNWWNWFAPTPVVMVTTNTEDGSYRCSPFSWVVPLSKKPELFGVLARKSSKTLYNIKETIDIDGTVSFTISLLKPSPDVAQRVLETRSGKPGTDMQLVEGFSDECKVFKIPEGSVVSMLVMSDTVIPLPGTHDMIVGKVVKIDSKAKSESPLLFYFGRMFAYAKVFEVEGY